MPSNYAAIGLVQPKNPINIGAALRAAGCYRAAFVAASGKRCRPGVTDTLNIYKSLPFFRVPDTAALHALLPYDCVPVAVDLIPGAQPLNTYLHPKRAFYIFGPEDGTLTSSVLDWCKHVVYVPTQGCMNLAATINVVLYARSLQYPVQV